jgi:hypothetical protein
MAPQPGRGLDAASSDPRCDPAPAQVGAVGLAVEALVGVELARPGAPPTRRRADRRDIVDDRLQHGHVRDVGGGDHRGQRLPGRVAGKVDLGPGLATIDGICANVIPPRLARRLAESTLARDQSSRPARPSRSRISRWSCSNTPALLEHAGVGPLVEPPPRGRWRAAAELVCWQEPPWGGGAGHEHDRGEAVAVGDGAGPAAPARGGVGVVAGARPAATARQGRGCRRGMPWRGIMPYHTKREAPPAGKWRRRLAAQPAQGNETTRVMSVVAGRGGAGRPARR